MIMRRNPCHDTDNPPGQITNPLQKKTFDEWLKTYIPTDDGEDSEVQFFECSNLEIWLMKCAWEAAQENI